MEKNIGNKCHVQAMVKAYAYMHCKSTNQQWQIVCIQDLVKFKGNYKFSFDFAAGTLTFQLLAKS